MKTTNQITLVTMGFIWFCLIYPTRTYSREAKEDPAGVTNQNKSKVRGLNPIFLTSNLIDPTKGDDSTSRTAHTKALSVNTNIIPIKCYGATTSVTISATGGLAPYKGTQCFGGLSAGTYSFTVTDADGCSVVATVTVSAPATLKVNSGISNALCYGGTGSVNITATGGTAPYRGTGTFSNLAPGSYSFVVLDNNDCPAVATATIKQPAPLTADASVTNALCSGTGSVNISAIGGTAPYKGTGNFTGLAAGSYSFTVVDANGCRNIAQATVAATTPSARASSTTNLSICTGQLPYVWNNNVYTTPGHYSIMLRNATGCDSVAVLNLAVIETVPGVPENISVSASRLPYAWNGSFYNAAGTYTTTVSGAAGCDSIATLVLTVIAIPVPALPSAGANHPQVFVPKAWTPNGDGQNDRLIPLLLKVRQLSYFRIYNRSGQVVFETRDFGAGWDGKINGQSMPMDVYTWIIEAVGMNGKIVRETGSSTLLRNPL